MEIPILSSFLMLYKKYLRFIKSILNRKAVPEIKTIKIFLHGSYLLKFLFSGLLFLCTLRNSPSASISRKLFLEGYKKIIIRISDKQAIRFYCQCIKRLRA